jgi:NitT/TauT family transport system permease protein
MKLPKNIQPILVFVLFILLWKAVIFIFNLREFILPQPEIVFLTYLRLLWDGTLITQTLVTLKEALAGFFIGSFIGASIGYIIGKSKNLESAFAPYIVSIQSMPVIAIMPLLAIWFGYGLTAKIIICSIIVFFPILVNTMAGIKNVDQKTKELFQLLKADKYQIFTKLEMPSLMTGLFTSFKIGIVFSIIGAIVGEFTGASAGLGYLILYSSNMLRTAITFAALLQLAITGVVLYYLLVILEQKLSFWNITSKMEKVTVVFPYLMSAEFLPVCTAINNGYYKEEGLNVKINYTAEGSFAALKQVARGRADFAYSVGGDSLIIARDKKIPVVAIYQTEHSNTFGIITRKESGITDPQQLAGKTIAVPGYASPPENAIKGMLKNSGVDFAKVKFIYTNEIIDSLLKNKVDAICGFLFFEEFFKSINVEINSMKAKDYGVNFPTGLTITSEDMIKNKNVVVEKFVLATHKGLKYAVDNSLIAVDDYMKNFNNTKLKGSKVTESGYWNRFIKEQYQNKMGQLDINQFNFAHKELLKMKLIDNKIDMSKAYTSKFIPK